MGSSEGADACFSLPQFDFISFLVVLQWGASNTLLETKSGYFQLMRHFSLCE